MIFDHLEHIYDPRERWLVGLADLALRVVTTPARLQRRRTDLRPPGRILLLRLERIGDLLMTLGAIESVRATWPDARIDLVVGSWNADVARQFPWIDQVQVLDVPWLIRDSTRVSLPELARRARRWREGRFDLAINLEGDIRSNLLMALSGAPVRVGFGMAGGRDLLTDMVPHDPAAHTDENTRQLVRVAADRFGTIAAEPMPVWPRFRLPAEALRDADRLLAGVLRPGRPLVGLHPSGGRAIKQWHPDRFGAAVAAIARDIGAAVVITGGAGETALVAEARAAMPPAVPIADLSGGLDLLTLAAVLSRLDLYLTGDTGPMHLAAAMGVPVVGIFGISDPARYAPLAPHRRVVRIDLPCSPCNRVRLPPERCRGHVPDCLEGISADMVHRAGMELFVASRSDTLRARRSV